MKNILLAALIILFMAGPAWSIQYSGAINSDGGGLFATEDWSGGNASFSWIVDDESNPGFWTYAYSWVAEGKDLSHINLEVSGSFTTANIFDGTTTGWDLDFHGENNGNPGIPSTMYGLKWEPSEDSLTFDFTVVANKDPIWGDVYAKSGKSNGNDVVAFNTGFGSIANAAIGSGNAMMNGSAWVLVPDTNGGGGGGGADVPIPEPSTLVLLGGGLVGLGLLGRRKGRKA